MPKFFKKLVVIVLIINFLVPVRTYAFLGFGDIVYDPVNWIENAYSAVKSGISTYLQGEDWVKEYILDPVVYVIAQRAATSIVNKTLRWAQNDFTGGPGYIDNFEDFFGDARDYSVNLVINDLLTNEDLANNPYAKDVARTILAGAEYRNIPIQDKLSDLINTYSSSAETNSGELKTYDQWLNATQITNTPIGIVTLANNILESKIQEEQEALKIEVESNGPILSQKVCAEGKMDELGNCWEWVTETPGSVVADRVRQALDVPINRINAADELSELVAASFGSLIDGLMQIGLGKLTTYAENELNDILNNRKHIGGPEDSNPGDWLNTPDIIVDLAGSLESTISDLELVIEYYENILNNRTSGLEKLVNDLDVCWPAPDQGWEGRLQTYLASLSEKLSGSDIVEFSTAVDQAVSEEKEMNGDALVNIPGSNTVQTLISANIGTDVSAENSVTQTQLATWKTTLWELLNVKIDVRTAARIARPAETWILFSEDWNALSTSAKTNILSSIGTGDSGNDTTNKTLVLAYYWDMWAEIVDDETKTNIRADFYAIQSSGGIPSSNIISRARGNSSSSENIRQTILDITSDCQILRNTVLDKKMSDIEVYNYLKGEATKQSAGITSAFKTDTFTSESAIRNSILSNINTEQLECVKPKGFVSKAQNLITKEQIVSVGASLFGNDFYNDTMSGLELSNASRKLRNQLEAQFDNVYVPWPDKGNKHQDAFCLYDGDGVCQVIDFCLACTGESTPATLASRIQWLEDPADTIQCIDKSNIYAGTSFDKYSSDSGKQVKNASTVYKIFQQDSAKQLFCRLENTSYGGVKPLCNPSGFDWYTNNEATLGGGGTCSGTEDPYKQVCILKCVTDGSATFKSDTNIHEIAEPIFAIELGDGSWIESQDGKDIKNTAKLVRDKLYETYKNVYVPWTNSNTSHFDAFCTLTEDYDEYGYQKCYVRDFVTASDADGIPEEKFANNINPDKEVDDVIYCSNFPVNGGGDGGDSNPDIPKSGD